MALKEAGGSRSHSGRRTGELASQAAASPKRPLATATGSDGGTLGNKGAPFCLDGTLLHLSPGGVGQTSGGREGCGADGSHSALVSALVALRHLPECEGHGFRASAGHVPPRAAVPRRPPALGHGRPLWTSQLRAGPVLGHVAARQGHLLSPRPSWKRSDSLPAGVWGPEGAGSRVPTAHGATPLLGPQHGAGPSHAPPASCRDP